MRQKLVILALAVLLVGSMTTAAVALATSDGEDRAGHSKARPDHERPGHENHGHGQDKAEKRARHQDKQAWKDHWRGLSPTERADLMTKLAQDHADGMRKWAACVRAAGDDRSARAACERPLPPGLAKKRLR